MKQIVAWAVLVLSAACSDAVPQPPDTELDPLPATGEPTPPIAAPAPPTAAFAPPTVIRSWEPSAAEPEPIAKRLAAEAALALTTYSLGATPDQVTGAVGLEADGELAAELVDPAFESQGKVVYAQFVGIGPSGASMTVLVEQTLRGSSGQAMSETRSLEIRLTRDGDAWRVSDLAAVGGPPTDRPTSLAAEANAVVDHPRIRLPSSARWDIYNGAIDPGLLRLLADVAEVHAIDVLTLMSGRPRYVFDTDVLSNHARGRAVDVYAVDGALVAEQREEGSAAHRLVRLLYDRGVEEIGSPWDLDGPGGRSFTDAAHQDHVHIAVAP